MKVRPLPGYVVLEPYDLKATLPGGLVLPEEAQQAPDYGKVIACGDPVIEDVEITCPVKVGEVVAHEKYGAQDIRIGADEYRLIPFNKLIGVIE